MSGVVLLGLVNSTSLPYDINLIKDIFIFTFGPIFYRLFLEYIFLCIRIKNLNLYILSYNCHMKYTRSQWNNFVGG